MLHPRSLAPLLGLFLLAACGADDPPADVAGELGEPVRRPERQDDVSALVASPNAETADPTPSERVSWQDPAGDVARFDNKPDQPRLDLVAVEAWTEDDALHVSLKVAESLDDHFAYVDEEGKKYAGVLAELYLDTDDDRGTGGEPNWAREADRALGGYEFVLSVQLGYDVSYLGDGGATGSMAADVVVDTERMVVMDTFATYQGRKLQQGSDSSDFDVEMPDWQKAKELTELGSQSVALRVPYDWLGIEPGQIVRLCFKETAQGAASGKGFSPDRWLRLE